MLISNTGKRIRNLTVHIPSERVLPPVPSSPPTPPNLFMDPKGTLMISYLDMIRAYQTESEAPATMICLESTIELNSIMPSSCRLVNLHFIVIQGMVHSLPDLYITDRDDDSRFLLRGTLQIYSNL